MRVSQQGPPDSEDSQFTSPSFRDNKSRSEEDGRQGASPRMVREEEVGEDMRNGEDERVGQQEPSDCEDSRFTSPSFRDITSIRDEDGRQSRHLGW